MENKHTLKEIELLIRYMIGHNESHKKEMLELADQIKESNKEAYELILKAISDFEVGNKKLEEALI